MQNKSWSISSKDFMPTDEDDDEAGHTKMNQVNEESEEEEEQQQQTVKPANKFSAAKAAMVERKLQEGDARAQIHKY